MAGRLQYDGKSVENDQELSDSDVPSEKGISSGRQTQKIND